MKNTRLITLLKSSIFPDEDVNALKNDATNQAPKPKSIILKTPKEIEYANVTPEMWKDSVVAIDEQELSVIQKLSQYEKNQLKKDQFMKIFNEYYEHAKEENDTKDHKHYSLKCKSNEGSFMIAWNIFYWRIWSVRAKNIDAKNMSHKHGAVEQDQKKMGHNAEVSI